MVSIEEFHNTKSLISTDKKLLDNITLKNIVILMVSLIIDGDKSYPQLFLEEVLFLK